MNILNEHTEITETIEIWWDWWPRKYSEVFFLFLKQFLYNLCGVARFTDLLKDANAIICCYERVYLVFTYFRVGGARLSNSTQEQFFSFKSSHYFQQLINFPEYDLLPSFLQDNEFHALCHLPYSGESDIYQIKQSSFMYVSIEDYFCVEHCLIYLFRLASGYIAQYETIFDVIYAVSYSFFLHID